MKKCIIVANGELPPKSIFRYLIRFGYNYLICADGGANVLFTYKIRPDVIIGDFDSILPDVLKYYKETVKIIEIKNHNNTDVEKALDYAINKGFEEAILLGGAGDRLDHTICNFSIILKYFKKINVLLLHDESILIPITGKNIFKATNNEIFSIYGFDKKTKIKSKGLKYPLDNIAVTFGEKESTSNVAIDEVVEMTVKGGVAFLIRNFQNHFNNFYK
ncbi:MAG: thiamine diphosphokinase [Ignavibacteriales bacterium]|nr:thiamine diphosphokinase [Ignavibacteriales bacterium]